MERIVRGVPQELSRSPCLAFPAWNVAMDESTLLQLYCDACREGFGAILEHEQQGATIRHFTFLSRVTLPNERNWTILDSEAGAIVWTIKRLWVYLFWDFLPYFC